jgi:hypothetical protein
MIRRLAYVSRPRPGLSPVEIPRLISACRRHNESEGICGVLLFTGMNFAQLIEGPWEPVVELWRRIRADDRHCNIVTFLDEPAPSPWFSDWRVGYPSDRTMVEQISAWCNHSGAFDEAERLKFRQLLMAVDAI